MEKHYLNTFFKSLIVSLAFVTSVTLGNDAKAQCSNVTNAGAIAASEPSGCSPFDPGVINSASLPSGGSGSLEYVWLKSTNGGSSYTMISNSNASTYNPPSISQTTWYRRCARRSGCSSYTGESNWVQVSVTDCIAPPSSPNCASGNFLWENNIDVNTLSGSNGIPDVDVRFVDGSVTQFVIPGPYPSEFGSAVTVNIDEAISWDAYTTRASTGNQPNEQWRVIFRKNGSTVYTSSYTNDLATGVKSAEWSGSLGSNIYLPNGVDQVILAHYEDNTYGTGSSSSANSVVPVSICISYTPACDNVTNAGQIGVAQSGCTPFDPNTITSISDPSGGSGALEYVWLQSTNGGSNYTVIAGANGNTYNPGALTQTTWFRRCARRAGCSSYVGESNWVQITVTGPCCDNVTDAGLIGYGQEGCYPFNPVMIQNLESPSGGSGALEYVWLVSTNGGSSYSVIPGANGETYDPPVTSTDQWFRRCARRAGCTSYVGESNWIHIDVTGSCPTDCNDGLVVYGGQCADSPDAFYLQSSETCIGSATNLYPINGSSNASCDDDIICVASQYNPGWEFSFVANANTTIHGANIDLLYPIQLSTAGGGANSSSCPTTFNYYVEFYLNNNLIETVNGSIPSDVIVTEVVNLSSPMVIQNGDEFKVQIKGSPISSSCDLFENAGTVVVGCCGGEVCETDLPTANNYTFETTIDCDDSFPNVTFSDASGIANINYVEYEADQVCEIDLSTYSNYNWTNAWFHAFPSAYDKHFVWENGYVVVGEDDRMKFVGRMRHVNLTESGFYVEIYSEPLEDWATWSAGGGYDPGDADKTLRRYANVDFTAANSIVGFGEFENSNLELRTGGLGHMDLGPRNVYGGYGGGIWVEYGGTVNGMPAGSDLTTSTNHLDMYFALNNCIEVMEGCYGLTVRDWTVTDNCGNAQRFIQGVHHLLSCDMEPTCSATNGTCNNGNVGTASVSVTGGEAPYSYLWDNGATTSSISGLSAGQYCVTVTDANGCEVECCATVTTQPVCCDNVTDAGEIAANQSNCGPFDPAILTSVSAPSGGSGALEIVWITRQGTSGGWTTIAGATGLTYDPPTVSTTTQYRRCARREGCTSYVGESNIITITVHPSLTASCSGENGNCSNGNVGSASVSVSGGTAPFSYAWSNGGTGSSISNLQPGTYSVTVTDANGCSDDCSVTITNESCCNVTDPGEIAANGSGCAPFDPPMITSVSLPSGGIGTIEYIWIMRTGTSGPWSTISGANGPTYDPGVITQTTQYRRCARRSGCTSWVGESNIITMTVTGPCCDNLTNGGQIAADQENCGPFDPAMLTSVSDPTGGSGNLEIIWLSGTCGTPVSQWTIIPGATGTTYNPGYLTETTCFIRCARREGCSAYVGESNIITITVNPGDISATCSSEDGTCSNGNLGSASVSANGGTAPYTYLWSTGATTMMISNLTAGSYSVTVTDANGCEGQCSVNVDITDCCNVTSPGEIAADQENCGGFDPAPFTSVSLPSGGLGALEYVWLVRDIGGSWSTVPGANGPTYDAPYTNTSKQYRRCARRSGCTSYVGESNILTITVNPEPTATCSKVDGDCSNNNMGSATVSASGGTGPYSYLWSTGANTASISGLAAGTYSVTVRDANGCEDNCSVTITTTPCCNVTDAGQIAANQENCGPFDPAPFTSVAPATGGIGPVEYLWLSGTCGTPVSSWTPIPNSNSATYDAGMVSTTTCFIRCSRNVGCTSWVGESNIITITVGPGCCDNVTNGGLIAEDQENCGGFDPAMLTSVSLPSGGSGAIEYIWLVRPIGGSYTTIAGATGPTYDPPFTNESLQYRRCARREFCTPWAGESNWVTITVHPDDVVASCSSENGTCNNNNEGSASVSASGGTAPYTYLWSTGATTMMISNLTAGSYSVTVTDANGCTDDCSVTVTTTPCCNVTNGGEIAADQENCGPFDPAAITSVTPASGGLGTLEYVWLWNPNNVSFNNGQNGWVEIANSNSETYDPGYLTESRCFIRCARRSGCSAYVGESNVICVTVNPEPTATCSKVDGDCNNNNLGSATVSASGGTAPYTYAWSNGGTTATINGLAAGTYSVTVTDANGCSDDCSVSITTTGCCNVTDPGEIAADQENCGGFDPAPFTSVSLPSGGLGTLEYVWLVRDIGGSWSTVPGANGPTYDAPYTSTSKQYRRCARRSGCTSYVGESNILTITVNPEPTATCSKVDGDCSNNNMGSATVSASGGTAPYSYAWSNGGTTATINGLAAGTYSVTVTDANGCTDDCSVTITATGCCNVTDPGEVAASQSDCGPFDPAAFTSVSGASGGLGAVQYQWFQKETETSWMPIPGATNATYDAPFTNVNMQYKRCARSQGCTDWTVCSNVLDIIINPEPSATCNATPADCNGAATGSASVIAAGGTAPYTYAWSNGGSTATITGLTAGTYSVTITDANGCTATCSATVTEPSDVTATCSSINGTCANGNVGSASVAAAGGTAPYTYAWSNGGTSASVSNLPAGTYSVTVTDANGCTETCSATVTITACCNVNNGGEIAANQENCGPFDPVTFTSVTDPSGGLGNLEIIWLKGTCGTPVGSWTEIAGATGLTYDPGMVTETTCFIRCSRREGCSSWVGESNIITITVNPDDMTATCSMSPVDCKGGANGTATASVSGGTAPYTYVWSTGATTMMISNLTAGSYSVTVTDVNGCTTNCSTTVTEPSDLTAQCTSTNGGCANNNMGSATVAPNGGTAPYSYSWSNGATTATISGLAAGTYTATVTDANGCVETCTTTVTVEPCCNVNNGGEIAANQENCGPFDPVAFTSVTDPSGGLGNLEIIWLRGTCGTPVGSWTEIAGATGLTYDPGMVTETTCFIRCSRREGCTQWVGESNIITITVHPEVTDATCSMTPVDCNGASTGSATVSVTSGTAPYTYAWSNGGTTATITGLAAGIYNVTVTDANGCSDDCSVLVTEPADLTATCSSTNGDCNNNNEGSASVTAGGGTAPYSYSWSNGETTASISGLAAGTYTATVTDANGCVETCSATITTIGCCNINNGGEIAANQENCGPFDPVAFTSVTDPSGGLGNLEIIWLRGTCGTPVGSWTPIAGATGLTYDPGMVTETTCFIRCSRREGCTQWVGESNIITITVNDEPVATCSSVNGDCNNNNEASASVSVSGGTAPFAYAWSNGETTSSISGLAAGTYNVTVTDANGCTDECSVTVTVEDCCNVTDGGETAGEQENCGPFDPAAITSVTPATGGLGDLEYVWLWNPNNVALNNGQNGWVEIPNSNSETYDPGMLTESRCFIRCARREGCDVYIGESNVICITVHDEPVATCSPVNGDCQNGNLASASVYVNGGTAPYTYTWNNGETTSSISGLAAGTYSVTVTDANGCTDDCSVTVTIEGCCNVTDPGEVAESQSGCGAFDPVEFTSVSVASGGIGDVEYQWFQKETETSWMPIPGATGETYDAGLLTINTQFKRCARSVGCTDWTVCSNVLYIEIHPEPLATCSSTPVDCAGGSNGTATVVPAAGTGPYTYLWSNGGTTATISGLSAGSYSVVVTDQNGCTAECSATVMEPAALSASCSGIDGDCNNGNVGSASVTPTGGVPPYSYSWSNGQTTASISGLGSGTYTATVTDANGCAANCSVTITANGCCNVTSGGQIAANQENCGPFDPDAFTSVSDPSGGLGNLEIIWLMSTDCNAPVSTWTTIPGATGLTYDHGMVSETTCFIRCSRREGCTQYVGESNIITVTVNDAPSVTCEATDADCNGAATGSATANATGGTAPYTYMWSTGATTAMISNLEAGSYIVTVTDAEGCSATCTTAVQEPLPLTADCSSDNGDCNNNNEGSASVTANGGTAPYTYSWSNGATTASVSGLADGTYTVTVTDANGCEAECTATITTTACCNVANGGMIEADQSNCGPFDPARIESVNDPVGGLGNLEIIWLKGTCGTPVATWTEIAGATGLSYDPGMIQETTCFIRCSRREGCTSYVGESNIVTITVYPEVTDAICSMTEVSGNGLSDGTATVAVTSGTPPYTYAWSNGGTTATITGLTAGMYSVVVTDANGCSDDCEVEVTEPNSLDVTCEGTNGDCNNNNEGAATVSAVGGVPPYTYAWSNGETTATIAGLAAGTYTATVTDVNGNTGSCTYTVETEPCCNVNNGGEIAADQSHCGPFDPDMLTSVSDPSGGLGNLEIIWLSSTDCNAPISQWTEIAGATGLTYDPGMTSETTCFIRCARREGCTAYVGESNIITITVGPGCCDNVTDGGEIAENQENCGPFDPEVLTSVEDPTGGSGDLEIIWLSGTCGTPVGTWTPIAGATELTYDPGMVTETTCFIRCSRRAGCTSYVGESNIITITVHPSDLDASCSMTPGNCSNNNEGTASATVTGGTAPYTYAWSNGETTETITGVAAGTYTVTVSDAGGCTATCDVEVTAEPCCNVTDGGEIAADQSGCGAFDPAEITSVVDPTGGLGDLEYVWLWNHSPEPMNNGQNGWVEIPNSNALTYDPGMITQTTCYIRCARRSGCDVYVGESNVVCMTVYPEPIATCEGVDGDCNNGNSGSASVTASAGTAPYTYLWSNGETTESISDLAAGTYSVTVTDANGCTATCDVTIGTTGCCNVTDGGEIAASQENCGPFDPDAFTSVSDPTGGLGDLEIIWLSGTCGTPVGQWDVIAGANGLTYDPGMVTETTCFIRCSRRAGCTTYMGESNIITITVHPSDLTADCNATAGDCQNNNEGSASVTVNGGTAPYTYAWSNGETTASISGLAAGTYTVSVTDANGCTATCDATVTVEGCCNITDGGLIEADQSNCGEFDPAELTSVTPPSGGLGDMEIVWIMREGTSGPWTMIPGSTGLTYDPGMVSTTTQFRRCARRVGCTEYIGESNIITITVYPAPIATCEGVDGDCNNGNMASASVSVAGGTAPYTYMWSNGETTEMISGLASGTYSVVVTDANGCEADCSVTVESSDCCNVTDGGLIAADQSYCEPFDPEMLTSVSDPTGGLGDLEIIWLSGTCGTPVSTWTEIPGANGLTYDPGMVTETTCFIRCARREGCTSYVGESNIITITVGDGCCDNLTDGGIIAENQENCGPFDPEMLTSVVDPTGGSGDMEIIWMSGECGTPVGTWTVIPGATGLTYDPGTVTETTCFIRCARREGCTVYVGESNIITITVNPGDLDVNCTSIDGNCQNNNEGSASVTATGGEAPYTYAWSNGGSTADISGLAAGTYSVVVTDANGCSADCSVTVETVECCNVTDGGAIAANQSNCGAFDPDPLTSVTDPSGGVGNLEIIWLSGACGTPISTWTEIAGATGLSYDPGMITETTCFVRCARREGCTAYIGESNIITITINGGLSATCSAEGVMCYGDETGTASVTVSGGSAPYTYAWSNGGTTEMIDGLAAGDYTVEVTDANGCMTSCTATVEGPAVELHVMCMTTDGNCENGNSGTATGNVEGGTPPYSYAWSNGETTQTVTGLDAGSYTVTVTDANGCISVCTAVIETEGCCNVTDAGLVAESQTGCGPFDPAMFTSVTPATGGVGDIEYQWFQKETETAWMPIPGATDSVYDADTVSINMQFKRCAKTADCPDWTMCSNVIEIEILPVPEVFVQVGEENLCTDGFVTLTAISVGAESYLWNNGDTAQVITVTTAGSYRVEVTDENGCTALSEPVIIEEGNCPPLARNDFNNTTVDTPVDGDVSTNDSDPDGDPLTFTQTSTPSNGTVSFNPDGTYTYTPNPGFVGEDEFNYVTCDNGVPSLCDSATVYIEVIDDPKDPYNNPPVANADDYVTYVDVPFDGTVITNDFDPDTADIITVTAVISGTSNGTLTGVNPDGTFNYSPNPGFVGDDSFTYVICDNGTPGPLCDTAIAVIHVLEDPDSQNVPPVAVDDAYVTDMDVPVDGDASLNDYDLDGDSPLTFTQTSTPANGSVSFNNDGSFTYTPDGGYVGPDNFTYEVCDGISGCDAATVYITILSPANRPPLARNDFNNTTVDTPVDGDVSTNDSDPDGDNLTFTQLTGTSNGTVTSFNPDGTYTYTPDPGFVGEDSFTYYTCDDGVPSLCDTATVYIEVIDDPKDPYNNPPVANPDDFVTYEDTPFDGTVMPNDFDPDTADVITVTAVISGPSNGTITGVNPDGTFNYSPDPGFVGDDEFTYVICDNGTPGPLCDTAIAVIHVLEDPFEDNLPPVAVDDAYVTEVDVPVNGDASLNDYDLDGDTPLTFTQTSTPSNGTVTFNNDGSFIYTPNSGYVGPDAFTYEVCDGISGCDAATVYITILSPANRPPVARNDFNNTLVDTPVDGDVSTNDSDPDGDNLTFTQLTDPSNGTITSFNPDGTYTYEPNPGFTGEDSFTYYTCDDGTPSLCDTATVYIEVIPAHDPQNNPPVANPDDYVTYEDTPFDGTVIPNDFDPDTADVIVVTEVISGPSNGTLTGVNPDGTFNYSPDPGFVGDDEFTYVICDNGVPGPLCDTTIAVIHVLEDPFLTNLPPVAVDDAYITQQDTPVDGDASLNDYDLDGDTPLTFTQLSNPSNGSVAFNNDGTFTYTPNSGYVGPDNFTYYVCDGISGCDTATVYITIECIMEIALVPTPLSCYESEDGSIDLTVSCGNEPLTFLWSNGETTEDISNLTAGWYTVTVTDAYGVTLTDSVEVTQPDDVEVTITPDGPTEFCEGESVTLTGTPGFVSYLWSTGETTESITVSTDGLVILTVTDSMGCGGRDEVYITVYPNPEVEIEITDGQNPACDGETIELTAMSATATSYMWSTGDSTAVIDVTMSGTYSVEVVDSNGCMNSASIEIIVNPNPEVEIEVTDGSNPFCEGESATLTAQSATAAFYMWSTGETSSSIVVTTEGWVDVVVTDQNGCSATDSMYIEVNPLPEVEIVITDGSNPFCEGDTLMVEAMGDSSLTYMWSTGATTAGLMITEAGQYCVTATDTNGCESTVCVDVMTHELPEIELTIDGENPFCEGDSVTIMASSASGISYVWMDGSTGMSLTVDTAGTYCVMVVDSNGCSNEACIDLIMNPAPELTVEVTDGENPFCEGDEITISAISAAAEFYLWSTGETTASINVTEAGTYCVTVMDQAGCTSDACIEVEVLDLPDVTVEITNGNNPFCEGDSVELTAVGSLNITEWWWSTGETTQSIWVDAAGVYVVDVISDLGCSNSATIDLESTPNPSPVIEVSGTNTFCEGETRTLTVIADDIAGVLWSTGETTTSITVSEAGEYCVEVTNSFGCTGNACHSVNQLPVPEVNAGPDVTICVGDSATLTANGGGPNAFFIWYQDGMVIDTAQSITVPAGTADGFTEYTVELHTTFCSYTDTDVIKVWTYSAPQPEFTRDPAGTVNVGQSIQFNSDSTIGAVTDWHWNFGDGHTSMLADPIHAYSQINVYTVTLTVSNNGCSDSISDMVDVHFVIDIPNVFTPNGDGVNDVIWVEAGDERDLELSFYNRWGHLMWSGKGTVVGWDGRTSAGTTCESGTYYYVAKYINDDGSIVEDTGYTQLIR